MAIILELLAFLFTLAIIVFVFFGIGHLMQQHERNKILKRRREIEKYGKEE